MAGSKYIPDWLSDLITTNPVTTSVPAAGIPAAAIGLVSRAAAPRAARIVRELPHAQEAFDWLSKQYPRLFNHALVSSSGRNTGAVARLSDRPLSFLNAQMARVRGEVLPDDPIADITLFDRYLKGGSVGEAVSSLAHEGQHLADLLRQPNKYWDLYKGMSKARGYEGNPYEFLANLQGALQRQRYQTGQRVGIEAVPDELAYPFLNDNGDVSVMMRRGLSGARDFAHQLIRGASEFDTVDDIAGYADKAARKIRAAILRGKR